jgi:hypothetical protein
VDTQPGVILDQTDRFTTAGDREERGVIVGVSGEVFGADRVEGLDHGG